MKKTHKEPHSQLNKTEQLISQVISNPELYPKNYLKFSEISKNNPDLIFHHNNKLDKFLPPVPIVLFTSAEMNKAYVYKPERKFGLILISTKTKQILFFTKKKHKICNVTFDKKFVYMTTYKSFYILNKSLRVFSKISFRRVGESIVDLANKFLRVFKLRKMRVYGEGNRRLRTKIRLPKYKNRKFVSMGEFATCLKNVVETSSDYLMMITVGIFSFSCLKRREIIMGEPLYIIRGLYGNFAKRSDFHCYSGYFIQETKLLVTFIGFKSQMRDLNFNCEEISKKIPDYFFKNEPKKSGKNVERLYLISHRLDTDGGIMDDERLKMNENIKMINCFNLDGNSFSYEKNSISRVQFIPFKKKTMVVIANSKLLLLAGLKKDGNLVKFLKVDLTNFSKDGRKMEVSNSHFFKLVSLNTGRLIINLWDFKEGEIISVPFKLPEEICFDELAFYRLS